MAGGISKANQRQGSKRKPRYDAYKSSGRSSLNGLKRIIRHCRMLNKKDRLGGDDVKAAYARYAAAMPNVAREMLAKEPGMVRGYITGNFS